MLRKKYLQWRHVFERNVFNVDKKKNNEKLFYKNSIAAELRTLNVTGNIKY